MTDKITITKEILPNKPETREFDSKFIESERQRLIKFFEDLPGIAYEAMIIISTMYTALARIYGRIGIENLPENLRQKYDAIVNSAMLAHAMVEDLKNYLILNYDNAIINELLKKGKNLETALQTWISEQVLQIDNYLAKSGDTVRDNPKTAITDYHGFIFQMFEKITFGFIAELLSHETEEDHIQQTFISYSNSASDIYHRLNNLKPVRNRGAAAERISNFNKTFGINDSRKIGYELLERSGYSSSNSLVGFAEITISLNQRLIKNIGKNDKYDFGSVKLPYPVDFIFPESPRIKQIREFIASLPEDVRPSLIPNYNVFGFTDNVGLETYRAVFVTAKGSYEDEAIKAISTMLVIERAKLHLYLATGGAEPLIVKSLKEKIAILEELRRQEALKLINRIGTNRAYEFTSDYIRDIFLHASDLSKGVAAAIAEVSNQSLNDKLPERIIFFLHNLERGLINSTKYGQERFSVVTGTNNVFDLERKPLNYLNLFDLHYKYRRREEEGPLRRPFKLEEFKKDLILNHSYPINPNIDLESQRTDLLLHTLELRKFQQKYFTEEQVINVFLKQFAKAKVKPELVLVNLFSANVDNHIIGEAIFKAREALNKANSQKPILNSNNLLSPKLELSNIINKDKPTGLLDLPNRIPNRLIGQQFSYSLTSSPSTVISHQNQPITNNWYRAIQSSENQLWSVPFITKLPSVWKSTINQHKNDSITFIKPKHFYYGKSDHGFIL